MKHIRDCWKVIFDCKSIGEVYRAIAAMPKWSGDWTVSWKDGAWVVSTEYHDPDTAEYITEEYELEITCPDLIIEDSELWSRDIKTGDIAIDKDVFDDFQEDTYITIMFSDLDDDTIYEYIMKSEDDDAIYLEYLA